MPRLTERRHPHKLSIPPCLLPIHTMTSTSSCPFMYSRWMQLFVYQGLESLSSYACEMTGSSFYTQNTVMVYVLCMYMHVLLILLGRVLGMWQSVIVYIPTALAVYTCMYGLPASCILSTWWPASLRLLCLGSQGSVGENGMRCSVPGDCDITDLSDTSRGIAVYVLCEVEG